MSKPFLSQCALIVVLIITAGCSTTQNQISKQITLAENGQCSAIPSVNKTLCLATDESVDGDVKSTLFIEGSSRALFEATTYLTPLYFIFSPNGNYIAIIETEEGHPFFAFYETKALLNNQNKVAPLMVLDDINLAHFEFLKDNGDVAYALTEGAVALCQSYEIEFIEGHPTHTERCVVGYNLETKQPLVFELPYRCKFNKE